MKRRAEALGPSPARSRIIYLQQGGSSFPDGLVFILIAGMNKGEIL
ncbi:hypothetical protein [Bacteroides pyogenes]|nr:hypothetical protein [Bacteroides pyogenes]